MSADLLPSWADGRIKSAIVDFVERVTDDEGPDFVPRAQRVATFDNDGTLWCEQPVQVQIFFALDQLAARASENPSQWQRQPYKAFLDRDTAAIKALGKEGAFEVAFSIHSGMDTDDFSSEVRKWFATSKHPTLNRLFTDCVYQPQLELLSYLRMNGFKTFIVSGGGVDVIRGFAEKAYNIPPEQVVGSSVKTRFDSGNGKCELIKLPEINSFDDRDAKPENIYLHIGRRPILAFGNSDGDLPMLRYARDGGGPRLALLLHHDDGSREFAYDREFRLSPLVDALDKADSYGITVVSMKSDWKSVFPEAAKL